MLALLEQKLAATGGLGNVNPMIYGLANGTSYGSVFHDVTSGNNNSTCVVGTQDCPNGGSIGYSAGTGYDLATGWGSLDLANFVNSWSQATPTGIGGSKDLDCSQGTKQCIITGTTVSTSAPICGSSSGSITLTINVSNGTASGGAPAGTVQILVDNKVVSDPASMVTLNSNGSATYTLNTSSISSGGHTISAVYSGNSTFAGSKGALVIDVVSNSKPDFSLTPCQATTSARSGSTATGVTLTLTPSNGFTGTVNLTATADTPFASQFAFSVNPVNITTTSGVTTVFTISAFQSSARTTNALNVAERKNTSQHIPWYAAGSGATLACALLFTVPRRRRWGALLAVVVSVSAFTASGCGSGSSSSGSSSTTTPVVTNATPGTYNVTVTAVAGTLVHSTVVTLTVQ
jgi:hypothetical protein